MKGLIFIDGGNLFHSIKEYNAKNGVNERVDFLRFSKFLEKETQMSTLLRTSYYTGVPRNIHNKQVGFLTMLETLPNHEVKKKQLKMKNGRLTEKGVDVQIVTDMLWCGLQKHCQHIVLVSGDEDLTDAVIKLKENGVRVTVAAFKSNASTKIIRSADGFIDLTQHVSKFNISNP
ncbi:MAG: NYN domain-containing protein [Candidatus Nanoarchaeia archaeon]